MRPGDIEGATYNFITTEEFENMIKIMNFMNIMFIMNIIMEHQGN